MLASPAVLFCVPLTGELGLVALSAAMVALLASTSRLQGGRCLFLQVRHLGLPFLFESLYVGLTEDEPLS